LADRQAVCPCREAPDLAQARPAAGRSIQRRRLGGQGRVGLADQVQQVAVQVELSRGDQTDNRDRDLLLEQGDAPGDEHPAGLGAVLVGRADDLHGGHQAAEPLGVVDPHLVLVLIRQVGGNG
jgi:hypothetical protein